MNGIAILILVLSFGSINPQIMKIYTFFILAIITIACSNNDDESTEIQQPNSNYVIPTGKTFEWRLDSLANNYTTTADVIDIDAFSATPELVANLKAQGKTVIAYLSVGSVENYRPDETIFPKA